MKNNEEIIQRLKQISKDKDFTIGITAIINEENLHDVMSRFLKENKEITKKQVLNLTLNLREMIHNG